MKTSSAKQESASELISERIAELGDWRGKTLTRMRTLIRKPTRTSSRSGSGPRQPRQAPRCGRTHGIICTGESYKSVVKLTFARGASLKDPARLFNSSLDGNVRRANRISTKEKRLRVRVHGAHPPGGRPQPRRQVESQKI
jgi:hypothetical protein